MNFRWIAALLFVVAVSPTGAEEIELVGVAKLSGRTIDCSGQTEELSNGVPHNRFGGISGLEYCPRDNTYLALADRGPDDGAVPYHCRFHKVEISLPQNNRTAELKLKECVMLQDRLGRPFTGDAHFFQADDAQAGRFDPEAIRIASNGNLYISDEYGPHIIEFSPQGKELRRFAIPKHFQIETPGLGKSEENEVNKEGRCCNRGMEGLTLSADGKSLVGLMQSPLLQDSARNEKGWPTGVNCRMVRVDLETGQTTEYLYVLDSPNNKLNEIVALEGEQYLVIERDGEVGDKAEFKKVMLVDLQNATPIQQVRRLPGFETPEGVRPIEKQVYIDLLAPKFGLKGKSMPEKLEGLTFGEPLSNGRRTLMVASDNDFEADSNTMVYIFAVPQ